MYTHLYMTYAICIFIDPYTSYKLIKERTCAHENLEDI